MNRAGWALLPILLFGSLGASCARCEEIVVLGKPEKIEQWTQKLHIWRSWVVPPGSTDERQTPEAARELIEAIGDPTAVPAIIAHLRADRQSAIRRYLLKPLIRLGGPDAVKMLVKMSVEDSSPGVREEAAKGLAGKPELPGFLETYISYLYKPQFATAAAQALRWNKLAVRQSMTDPIDPKLTKALIAALVQKQKKRVPYWMAVDSGWIGHAGNFGGTGGSRYAEFRNGWIDVLVPESNPETLQTLKEYSLQDYGYDQDKWSKTMETGKLR